MSCRDGVCCLGQTPECGKCWDYCKPGKIGKFVEKGPLGKLDSREEGSVSLEEGGSSTTIEVHSSMSLSHEGFTEPRRGSGPTGLSIKGSRHERKLQTDPIKCEFKCESNGACTHKKGSIRWGSVLWEKSGSCIRKGKSRKLLFKNKEIENE